MTRSSQIVAGLALALLAPLTASAQVDRLEALEGPTLMSAVTGDGGLTVGVAPTGEVTQILWPTPLGVSQITHETSAIAGARELPRFGAERTDGLLVGLWLQRQNDAELTWLRDAAWSHSQAYDGSTVVQTSTRDALGLRVLTSTTATGDRMVVRTALERADTSPILNAWVVVFADVAPGDSDWLAYWDPEGERLISFSPTDPSADGRASLMEEPWTPEQWEGGGFSTAEALAAGLPGTYLALGGASPSAVHVGARTGQDCIAFSQWAHPPSAWDVIAEDIGAASQSGAPVAACDVDVAMAWPVEFKDDGPTDRGAVDFFLAAAPSVYEASSRLDGARDEGFDALRAEADVAGAELAAGLDLPSGAEAGVTAFAERWARGVVSATDEATGAMAASPASQPLFHVDRPWESAWTELALELAGDFEAVSRHQRWLAEQQVMSAVTNTDGGLVVPPGAWVTDRGGLDIAQVGLTAWSYWRHAQYAPNERKARATLASSWTSLAAAADLLTTCVADDHPALASATSEVPAGFPAWWALMQDLRAGEAIDQAAGLAAGASGSWEQLRPCDSNEGGAEDADATLLATQLARLGLVSAVAAAEALCVDDPRVAAWQARADELAAVMLAADFSGEAWTGRAPLMTWPAPLEIAPAWRFAFAADPDPEAQEAEVAAYVQLALTAWVVQEHARAVDAITLQTDGRGDEALALLAGVGWSSGLAHERLLPSQARAMLERLVTDLATPTGHLGGAFVVVEEPLKGADQRVGQPNVSAASQAVVALLAYDQPELLEPARDMAMTLTCPTGEEPNLQRQAPACGADCQSSVAGRAQGTSALVLLLGLVGLSLRRRRR